jgi:hypothetical protein
MLAFFRSHSSHFAAIGNHFGRCWYRIALLWLLLLTCGAAAAQNTTISGTVYDPRGASGLPLPNVLVYASTTPVSAPTTGTGQCLTYANQTPTGANVVSTAPTATDGTFTLQNIPENASYTVVIQAGKWQRQFSETVGTTALTGLVLSMPADHTQGNIPYIAIVTGSVDGAECVLHDMGISDSEFTDDNQAVNPGGRIHLYTGAGYTPARGKSSATVGAGAEISGSTPTETALTLNATLLNSYDMVMFPCQGSQFMNMLSPTSQGNLVDYANAGGRLFTTHFSYVYLDSSLYSATSGNAQYNAQFGNVATWAVGAASLTNTEQATVQTNFSDGAILAQWLENSGATVSDTSNQIDIGTVRVDVSSVVPPTQLWVTLNSDVTYPNPSPPPNTSTIANGPMQMTFNAPVGAPLANQCGRVMFNDYHVIDLENDKATGKIFPAECSPETGMSAQEEMLEYALFDLSGFVQPVVNPTLNVTFNPSPLVVKSGDTADQLTVNVINTSTTTETDSSAVLGFSLPSQLTITAMSDPTGGWICTVSTASCSRNSSLPASTTDSVTLTISVASYSTLPSYSGTITATVSSVTFSTNPSFQGPVIFQQAPPITWATPANIVYGTPLSGAQLDASSTLAGTFTYSPAAGTILGTGKQTLNTTFTPTDMIDYTTATASVTLTVVPGTPVITVNTSPNPVFADAPVTLTASLPSYASAETGTMTFYSGTTALGTANVSGGSATLTTTSLAAGTQSITAAYSGDANYAPATSSGISETVQDFTLAFAGGNGTVTAQPGGQATYSLVVTPTNGALLPAAVTLSASNLPLGMTASFSPATITAGSAATTVTMTITLPGKTANERPRSPFGGGALPVALGLILLPFVRRMRKARARLARLMVLLAIGAALAVGFTGCGAKINPQNFTFSVTAASGTLSHSLTPGLTVE